jgi:hypothetical protein
MRATHSTGRPANDLPNGLSTITGLYDWGASWRQVVVTYGGLGRGPWR